MQINQLVIKIIDALKKGGKYLFIAGAAFYALKMYKEFKK